MNVQEFSAQYRFRSIGKIREDIRFDILTVVMTSPVFWNLALCSLIEGYRCFGRIYFSISRVQHTRLHCVTFQKVELLKSEKALKENVTNLDLLTNEFIICTVTKQIETLLPMWNIVR